MLPTCIIPKVHTFRVAGSFLIGKGPELRLFLQVDAVRFRQRTLVNFALDKRT
jgi:hypothetical protein